jgi:hypothetical protein
MIYERPYYYAVSHIFFGFIAAWFPWFGIFIVTYQLLQLAFNVRVFVIEGSILPNNTWQHTAQKLSEIGLGYIIGLVVKKA